MAADPTVRVVEMSAQSTHDELFAIGKRMKEDGLNPACTDEQKIGYLWRLYLQTESDLKAAIATIDELQEQQVEEMKEVENYVEHIRNLSSERGKLTLEFEAENEELKNEAQKLRDKLKSYENDETKEMLEQQGLHDILDSSTTEQIAYLLVERARLLDELEAEQTEAGTLFQTPDGAFSAAQLWAMLSQERREFERDLAHHKANLQKLHDSLKDESEEEITVLMSENSKLQDLLDATKRRMANLEGQIEDLESELDKAKRSQQREKLPKVSSLTEIDSEELKNLKKRVAELEADNSILKQNAEMMEKDFAKDKSSSLQKIKEQEEQIKRVTKECDEQQAQLKTINRNMEQVKMENQTLEDQLSHMQKLLKPKKGASAESTGGDETKGQLVWETEKLRRENVRLMGELDNVQSEAAAERSTRREAESKARTAISEARDLREEKERMQNLHMAKMKALESKIESLEGEVANGQKEKWMLKNEHRKELEVYQANASEDTEELRAELKNVKQAKRSAELKVKELMDNIEAIQQKMNKEIERGRRLDAEKAQLQVQVEELSIKLSVANQAVQEKDTILKEEQRKFKENLDAKEMNLADVVRALQEHKENHKLISEKLVSKEAEVEERLQSMDRVKMTTEERLISVKEELTQVRLNHQDQVNKLNRELDQLQSANKQLQQKIEVKEQELTQLTLRLEDATDDAKSSRSQLEHQLELEMNRRSELEGRNKALEEETAKAWSKLQDILEKVTRLESDNDLLKAELQRKSASSKDIEEMFNKREGDREARLKTEMSRAETAEKKIYELQLQLDRAQSRLQTVEEQLKQLSPLRDELQKSETDLARLKAELKSEARQRTSASSTVEELRKQITAMHEKEQQLQQRNNELQHVLLDVQNKLDNMKDQASVAASLRNENEANQRSAAEQVLALQKDVENLQLQLITAADKYDLQCRRYAERKIRTKEKLQKARDVFLQEKSQLKVELEQVQNELIICKATLEKEQEGRSIMEKDHRLLLAEKRDLLSELSEKEETEADQKRQLSVLQVRARYLEEENAALQQRVDSLIRQKHNLDKMVNEYQLKSSQSQISTTAFNSRAMSFLPPHFLNQFSLQSRLNKSSSSIHSDGVAIDNSLDPDLDKDHSVHSSPALLDRDELLHQSSPLNISRESLMSEK